MKCIVYTHVKCIMYTTVLRIEYILLHNVLYSRYCTCDMKYCMREFFQALDFAHLLRDVPGDWFAGSIITEI